MRLIGTHLVSSQLNYSGYSSAGDNILILKQQYFDHWSAALVTITRRDDGSNVIYNICRAQYIY